MAVSRRTFFIWNALALLFSPPIGNALHLSQSQFGLWAALAIHDTSSVGGAATKCGAQAVVIATTVKLARALWIVPLALLTAAIKRSRFRNASANPTVDSRVPNASTGGVPGDGRPRIQFPWFILFFLLAALANT